VGGSCALSAGRLRTQAAADSAVAASHAALATDEIAVFLALGGGWQ
jgi:outer membrane protein, multidrug efflux system